MRRVARSESVALTKTHCGFPKGSRPFGALLPPLLGACQEVASTTAAHCAADQGMKAKFQTTASTDAHTVSRVRVKRKSSLRFSFLSLGAAQRAALCESATSWHSPRSRQEGNQGDTPWDPTSRRLFESRRGFCFRKPPPSWAHKRTPKMGSL